MKILHTSDWHLGRSLYGRKRYKEFAAFLDWLASTIEKEKIDTLLIAGDVFDTSTPGNKAQELYYRFLFRVSTSGCRNIVVTGGNHDSPSFLNAPKEILRALNVYVVGAKPLSPEDEVIVLYELEIPTAIICAVPYLRDKDIRVMLPGETIDDKNRKLVEGIRQHYSEVCSIAENKRKELLRNYSGDNPKYEIPIIAMGHLFTAGGKTVDGDGVRELYVGSLAHVENDIFPLSIDYTALGHLHVPQKVGGKVNIRYSGSPLPMGFGESKQTKQVIIAEFKGNNLEIKEIPAPCFQQLEQINGSLDEIKSHLDKLKQEQSTAWVEIEYTGKDIVSNLREILDRDTEGSEIEILRVKNKQVFDKLLKSIRKEETLDDLDESDVFERCLDAYDVEGAERKELTMCYNEIIQSLNELDINKE